MTNIDNLRALPIIPILQAFGLSADPNDPKQFKDDRHRISIDGVKFCDHCCHENREVKGSRGGGAIDLVKYLNNCNFVQAVEWLTGGNWQASTPTISQPAKPAQESFIPAANPAHLAHVRNYLTQNRKRNLDAKIVDWCIGKGVLFADDFKNCVFLYGTGAELRGTGNIKWNRCYGQLNQAFFVSGSLLTGKVVFCESAIDALSYRQLNPTVPVFGTAGCQRYTLIKQVLQFAVAQGLTPVCGFDNPEFDNGEGEKAYQFICNENPRLVIGREVSKTKDWNGDLT